MLRSKYPGQVHDYTCKVDNIRDGKLYLSGLEEMGDTVLDHFKKCLEFQYPTDSLGVEPSLMEVLKLEHETFMFQRSQVNNWTKQNPYNIPCQLAISILFPLFAYLWLLLVVLLLLIPLFVGHLCFVFVL